jgi:Cu/Ag efflux pump CusA
VLATAAAVLPLLFLGRVAGTEALFPFAVVVLGGLVTTTLLVVLVVPALYLRFASGLRLRGRPPGPSIPEGGQ